MTSLIRGIRGFTVEITLNPNKLPVFGYVISITFGMLLINVE
jgi:hypothetical protein